MTLVAIDTSSDFIATLVARETTLDSSTVSVDVTLTEGKRYSPLLIFSQTSTKNQGRITPSSL